MEALRQIDAWPVEHAAVGVAGHVETAHGNDVRVFRWASVTKPATALAVLVALEEGLVDLDEPAGPPGSTVRHLLAHASGVPPEQGAPIARPGERRIYSNYGFDLLAERVAERAEMAFRDYFDAVFAALGIVLEGRPSTGAEGNLQALLSLGRELLAPTLVAAETLAEATAVAFPGLAGVLPGFGRMDPNDWGLGFELRNGKTPHWTGSTNSPRTFGHFGQTGTFLWVDPEVQVACACLTDGGFGDWAKDAWPRLSDAVVHRLRHPAPS